MKRCLDPICGLLNDDFAKVCKSCKSKNFIPFEEPLPSVSVLNVGLLNPPKNEASPVTNVVAESQNEHSHEGRTKTASPKGQKRAEGLPFNATSATASRRWSWVVKQFRDPLVGFAVGLVGLVLAFVSLPQVLYLWNRHTNNAPVIKLVMTSPSVIQLGEEVKLTAVVNDVEDGSSVNYEWANSAGIVLGTGAAVTLTTTGIDRGSAPAEINVVLIVADSQQAHSKPYPVSIKISNSKPRLRSIEVDKMELRVGEPVQLIAVADDPGGDRAGKLHYEWNCPVGQIGRADFYKTTLQTSGLNLRSAPIFPKVRVTVTNDRGESTEGEITLSITPALRRVYKARRSQPKDTTKLIVDVVKPLALDLQVPRITEPQSQTPGPQLPANPPEARSPDISKPPTKPPS